MDSRMIYDSDLFLVTFSSSVFTAAFGIAKYLKMGPCRLLPNEGPPLGGYGQIGFLLVMVNVASTIFLKGFVLGAIGNDRPEESQRLAIIVWLFACYIPNFLYVSV